MDAKQGVDLVQIVVAGVGVIGAVGLSGLLVRFILTGHATRISELEKFSSKVKMPNVGESMCDERHGTMEKGLKFLFEEHRTFMGEIKADHRADHDVLTTLVAKLDTISEKIDQRNGRKDESI